MSMTKYWQALNFKGITSSPTRLTKLIPGDPEGDGVGGRDSGRRFTALIGALKKGPAVGGGALTRLPRLDPAFSIPLKESKSKSFNNFHSALSKIPGTSDANGSIVYADAGPKAIPTSNSSIRPDTSKRFTVLPDAIKKGPNSSEIGMSMHSALSDRPALVNQKGSSYIKYLNLIGKDGNRIAPNSFSADPKMGGAFNSAEGDLQASDGKSTKSVPFKAYPIVTKVKGSISSGIKVTGSATSAHKGGPIPSLIRNDNGQGGQAAPDPIGDRNRKNLEKARGKDRLMIYDPLHRIDYESGGQTGGSRKNYANSSTPHGHNARSIQRFNNLRIMDEDTELMEKGAGYVFFPIMDMRLDDANGGNSDTQGTPSEVIPELLRLDMHIQDQLSGGAKGGYRFINALTNQAMGFQPQDTVMGEFDMKENMAGYKMIVPSSMIQSLNGGFQIEYLELENGDITNLHKIWMDYIHAVRRGYLSPKRDKILDNIIDYMNTMYYIVLGPDGMSVKYWCKFTGVWPSSISYGSYQTSRDDKGTDIVKVTVNYKFSHKEDLDLAVLVDFARHTKSIRPEYVQEHGATYADNGSVINIPSLVNGVAAVIKGSIQSFWGYANAANKALFQQRQSTEAGKAQQSLAQNNRTAVSDIRTLSNQGSYGGARPPMRTDLSFNTDVRLESKREDDTYKFYLRFYNRTGLA